VKVKSDQPLLSIIVPVFNGADTLPTALKSILQQCGAELQIILVDDGSTDASVTVARQLVPNSIASTQLTHVQQENRGPAAARNRGLALAQGEFISFLDADDYWPAGRIQHHMALFRQNPAAAMVIGTTQLARLAVNPGAASPILPAPLIQQNLGAITCRRSVFESVGVFNETLRIGEDKEWFQRVLAAGLTLQMSRNVALVYQLREGSLTYGAIDHNRWFLAALRDHLRLERREAGASLAASAAVDCERIEEER
jgi:glycosyltransferase involved in cell wall biosynthesis